MNELILFYEHNILTQKQNPECQIYFIISSDTRHSDRQTLNSDQMVVQYYVRHNVIEYSWIGKSIRFPYTIFVLDISISTSYQPPKP